MAKPTILIVDDDALDRRMIRRYLRQCKHGPFDFVEAASVRDAGEVLDRDYACVLLDHGLPDGTAFDVLKQISELPQPAPVLVLTGAENDELALKLLSHGADDYLMKAELSDHRLSRAVSFSIARSAGAGRPVPPTATESKTRPLQGKPWVESFRGEVGGYTIERPLGSGAMGAVFLATQSSLGRQVAIKAISPLLLHDTESVERFEQEARILASFDSPFIVPVYDMFRHDDLYCIVMAYATGGSVLDLLEGRALVPVRRALKIARDAALGLDAAARNGIVHRDIKPANLLLTASGQTRVGDFGLAKLNAGTGPRTETGIVLGSAAYIAPESWYGSDEIDTRTDLYALGCTLYQLLTGRLPFEGSCDLVMRQHLEKVAPDPSVLRAECPRRLVHIVGRLLEKDPDQRYQNGAALGKDLHDVLTRRRTR